MTEAGPTGAVGFREPPLVGSWIERRARSRPDHPALIYGDDVLTYAQLASRIRRLANGLRSLGVRPGDRVSWMGDNHPAFLESMFAASMVGAALAPMNHRLDPARIGAQLADAAPVVLVHLGGTNGITLPEWVRAVVAVDGTADTSATHLDRLLADSSDEPTEEVGGIGDVCLIPFTSGTTGPSKGVMLTHGNVTWNVLNVLMSADFRGDDVTIAIAPFFRSGGTGVNVLPTLFMGGTVVVPESLHPDAILGLTERHRASVGFANPDLLQGLADSPLWGTADLSSLRFVMTGGAPVPDRLIRLCMERGFPLLQGYGLSEAAPFVMLLDAATALRKGGAAGKPPPFVDVRIVRQDGTEAAVDETGELVVRGPNVMAGYMNRPEDTARALREDGWLHTGDAARVDDEGDVWIVDRLSDGFISGGRFVFPGDVERAVADHPAVRDVGVVGVPPAATERTPVAFVVVDAAARATPDEILAFASERLPAESVPRSVVFVDALPRSSVGKLLRHDLAALAEPR